MLIDKLSNVTKVNLSVISRMRSLDAHPISNGMNPVRDSQFICYYKSHSELCEESSVLLQRDSSLRSE